MGLWHDVCNDQLAFEITGNYTVALDQNYAGVCDCGFVVMWSDRANELQPKEVNLGICSHAKVYFIMEHRTGETCF